MRNTNVKSKIWTLMGWGYNHPLPSCHRQVLNNLHVTSCVNSQEKRYTSHVNSQDKGKSAYLHPQKTQKGNRSMRDDKNDATFVWIDLGPAGLAGKAFHVQLGPFGSCGNSLLVVKNTNTTKKSKKKTHKSFIEISVASLNKHELHWTKRAQRSQATDSSLN